PSTSEGRIVGKLQEIITDGLARKIHLTAGVGSTYYRGVLSVSGVSAVGYIFLRVRQKKWR
ncbi:MAG TPA: hypothetical protein VEI28_07680, partial [Thermodesulfovibrionales bacterium]|nr:hypothetical protein [Thermodesulfovibrionales bacterium]